MNVLYVHVCMCYVLFCSPDVVLRCSMKQTTFYHENNKKRETYGKVEH